MKLDIKSRLLFGAVFPEKDGLINKTLATDIIKRTALTQEEFKEYGVAPNANGLQWNPEKDTGVKFVFSVAEIAYMKSCVDRLDKEKAITSDLLPICNLIMKESSDATKD